MVGGVSDMDAREMAYQVRLSHWAGIMRERKDSGQSIRSWCRENGLKEKTFYYWQRRLRKAACEQFAEPKAASETSLAPIGFAEVRLHESAGISRPSPTPPAISSDLRVEIGEARITAGGEYPAEKLAVLVRELMRPC